MANETTVPAPMTESQRLLGLMRECFQDTNARVHDFGFPLSEYHTRLAPQAKRAIQFMMVALTKLAEVTAVNAREMEAAQATAGATWKDLKAMQQVCVAAAEDARAGRRVAEDMVHLLRPEYQLRGRAEYRYLVDLAEELDAFLRQHGITNPPYLPHPQPLGGRSISARLADRDHSCHWCGPFGACDC